MQIYILLTENCNLSCAMCIRGKQHGVNIDIDKLKNIIQKNDFRQHDLVITGGEPSIHKNYSEIVSMMCKNAKTVTVTSNGTLSLCFDKLKKYDNLKFQISLDGDMIVHDQIRGRGAFEKTWKTIEMMEILGVKYSIASVVSHKNEREIFDLIPKLKTLSKMLYWRVSYEMPFGSAKCENFMSAEEWNSFVDELLKKVDFRLKIQKIFPFELYEKRKQELEKLPADRFRSINCGSGKNKIYIYPDFKVYPCTCLTDFCIGSLSDQSLSEILISDKAKIFSEYQLADESLCINCEYLKYCNGGCIGMSYHCYGKLGMGDKRCPKLFERTK